MSETTVHETNDLKAILSDIALVNTVLDFKWKFEISEVRAEFTHEGTSYNGWFVNVAFDRPDTNTGEISVGRGRKEFIQEGTTVSGVVKTAWLLLELIVRHELMEGFRWRNKRIFNPHNSVFSLASIQEN